MLRTVSIAMIGIGILMISIGMATHLGVFAATLCLPSEFTMVVESLEIPEQQLVVLIGTQSTTTGFITMLSALDLKPQYPTDVRVSHVLHSSRDVGHFLPRRRRRLVTHHPKHRTPND